MALRWIHDPVGSRAAEDRWNEKESRHSVDWKDQSINPVVESARFVYRQSDIVKLNQKGVKTAARHIYTSLINEGYSPHTWRQQPLHLLPPQQYLPADPRTKACLDWIFLVSSLNFNFWSEKEGTLKEAERFGVEWREGWGQERRRVWTGYWSLVAAINKALEAGVPITDPLFYASKKLCPDAVIQDIFKPGHQSTETVPLMAERISVMREVGAVLNAKFGGSYAGLLSHFLAKHSGHGTALQLVQMIVDEFPPFRDEGLLEGQKGSYMLGVEVRDFTWRGRLYSKHPVYFWKRAQILVAETWAAFYPSSASTDPHPFFPYGISQLTMFADYRILHHLKIITYPPALLSLLTSRTLLSPGSRTEMSIRAASILAVEAVRDEILRLHNAQDSETGMGCEKGCQDKQDFPSVVIDFFLWDLAKKVERGEERIEGIETSEMVPAHRTRSTWY